MHRKLPRCSLLSISAVPHIAEQISCLYRISLLKLRIRIQMCIIKIRSRRCRDPNPPAALFQPAFFGYDTIRHAYNRIIPGRIFLCHNICSLMPPFSSVISFKHPGINIRNLILGIIQRLRDGEIFYIIPDCPA